MGTFLVISPHSDEECIKVLQDILAMGYLTHFDWGCSDGDHTGWAMIDADTKAEALMSVPAFVRGHARVVRLVKFDPEQVRAMHPKT